MGHGVTAGTSPGGDRDWGIPEQPAGPAGGDGTKAAVPSLRSERSASSCVEEARWERPEA